MNVENPETYYTRRAQQELDLASATVDPAIKKIHLNLAGRFAAQSELAVRTRDGKADKLSPAIDRSVDGVAWPRLELSRRQTASEIKLGLHETAIAKILLCPGIPFGGGSHS